MKNDFWTNSNKNVLPLENGNEEVYSTIYDIGEKDEHDFKILCIYYVYMYKDQS